MKRVKATITLEFDTEEVDDETLKEAIAEAFEEKAENDELLEKKTTKLKITDLEEEDEEPDYEDDEDDE